MLECLIVKLVVLVEAVEGVKVVEDPKTGVLIAPFVVVTVY